MGAPGAARVGPFTFHPAVTGVPGTPARVIIHPVEASRTVLTMTGWNCRTGRPFRFWYAPYGVDGELPRPVRQAPDEGATAVTIPALAAGDDYLGYMLFPGAGEWDVELRDGTALVGNLLFVLPDAR